LRKRQPNQVVYPAWQTFFSILAGISVGFVLLLVLGRSHGQALSYSLTQAQTALGVPQANNNQGTGFPGLPSWPNLNDRMNLLVMGVDSNGKGTQRFVGTRSDTMMIVSLDPAKKKVGLVSIPRDSRVAIEGHGTDKINSAHAFGGPDLAVSTVRNTFMVQIDHYVAIDTQGLKTLFEALGPVEILVEKPMHYRDRTAGLNVDLQPGLQTLDPAQAEEYVRFRHDALGDIGRMERQQWFLRQVARKLREPQVVLKLPELIAFARDNVVTDLTAEDMVKLVTFLKDIQPSQVETATMPGTAQMIAGGSYWLPDMDRSRIVLQRLVGTGLVSVPSGPTADAESGSAPPPVASDSAGSSVVKPITVGIRYPRGAEDSVQKLEAALTACGYSVRYKWQAPAVECQHEQITQNSERADEMQTEALRKNLPDAASWPCVLAIDSRPATDFTLVISPTTAIVAAPSVLTSPVGRHVEHVLSN
jgi:LCP family protein required for cell wall assembly